LVIPLFQAHLIVICRLLTVIVGAALLLPACARTQPSAHSKPDHVLVMVFDQMRPDYIDRFNLEHFKRLRASARNYPDAYVGHLASQTVVSHLVIPTGLLPRDLPWLEDVLLDAEGTLGKPDAAYKTDDLTRDQMWRLLERVPKQRFLQSRIRDALGPVFAIGEKNYAAVTFGGPYASAIVTLAKAKGRCTPDGVNVPRYIADNPRFSLDCAETYGTGLSTIYALDGSRYVPGNDASHAGGDVWTADAALEVMRRESWSGLFLTFGGIDKVAHMLGEQDGPGLASVRVSTAWPISFASPMRSLVAFSTSSTRSVLLIERWWLSPRTTAASVTRRTSATTGFSRAARTRTWPTRPSRRTGSST
jgi:hypothetical protein